MFAELVRDSLRTIRVPDGYPGGIVVWECLGGEIHRGAIQGLTVCGELLVPDQDLNSYHRLSPDERARQSVAAATATLREELGL